MDIATARTDHQVFVIYDSPEVTDIPLPIRSNWIRRLYPNAEVLEAWGGPSEVGLTPAVMAKQEDFLLSVLGDRIITHFFSSEGYGGHVAERLGALDVRVDQDRSIFPISGTAIRADAYANREFLDPIVYNDLILKVLFLGAPSSGKSTITELCAKEFQTKFMPEFGREYWEKYAVDRRLTPEQMVEIAIGHRLRQDQLTRESSKYLFVDTDATTTEIFAEYYHGFALDQLQSLSFEALHLYDVVFLCDIDFPYADTEDRSGEANQKDFQNRILSKLAAHQRPYLLLKGTVSERLDQVKTTLQNTVKYQNPIEWGKHA
jgi:NadR type nicotinamide-nucleotide adenylyltransferase